MKRATSLNLEMDVQICEVETTCSAGKENRARQECIVSNYDAASELCKILSNEK